MPHFRPEILQDGAVKVLNHFSFPGSPAAVDSVDVNSQSRPEKRTGLGQLVMECKLDFRGRRMMNFRGRRMMNSCRTPHLQGSPGCWTMTVNGQLTDNDYYSYTNVLQT